MIWFWASLLIALLVLEGLTAALVSIWFACGALGALIVTLFAPGLVWLQIVLFIVISVVALVATRPLARRYRTRSMPTNADRNIGAEGIVLDEIGTLSPGRVKVNGMEWSAVSETGDIIPADAVVTVKSISGAKITVALKSDGGQS